MRQRPNILEKGPDVLEKSAKVVMTKPKGSLDKMIRTRCVTKKGGKPIANIKLDEPI